MSAKNETEKKRIKNILIGSDRVKALLPFRYVLHPSSGEENYESEPNHAMMDKDKKDEQRMQS